LFLWLNQEIEGQQNERWDTRISPRGFWIICISKNFDHILQPALKGLYTCLICQNIIWTILKVADENITMKFEVTFNFRYKSSISWMKTVNNAINLCQLRAICTAERPNDSSTLTNTNVINEFVISNYFHAESCNQLNQTGLSVIMTKCNFTIFLWWHCISPVGATCQTAHAH
jgi:hypothetical protein